MSIAVVVPIYKEFYNWNHFERLSIENNFNILDQYDKVIISPNRLIQQNCDLFNSFGIKVTRVELFEDEYFDSIENYNKLLTSVHFYQRFSKWDFIFICQTDAWIFKDELVRFSQMGFSYIGGICFSGFSNPSMWSIKNILGAINGGVSLRRINDHVELFNIDTVFERSIFIDIQRFREYFRKRIIKKLISRLLKQKHNEDFIIFCASKYYKSFVFGDVTQRGISLFSWDVAPSLLFNHFGELPMAAHAWFRSDGPYRGNKNFWENHIKKISSL
jgi:hypothetical protein